MVRTGRGPLVSSVAALTVAATLTACAGLPTAGAEPADNPDDGFAAPAVGQGISESVAVQGDPITDACNQFSAAIGVAAANYEEFAYATAGTGNYVNYQDPTVSRSNVVGRTALREAAGAALDASRMPGLPPEVSDPMQAWSLHATKLLVIMGLRGGGDSLNNAATQLNADAENAQTACALAMARS